MLCYQYYFHWFIKTKKKYSPAVSSILPAAHTPWQMNGPLRRRMHVAEDKLWGLRQACRRLEQYVEDFIELIELILFHPAPRTSTYRKSTHLLSPASFPLHTHRDSICMISSNSIVIDWNYTFCIWEHKTSIDLYIGRFRKWQERWLNSRYDLRYSQMVIISKWQNSIVWSSSIETDFRIEAWSLFCYDGVMFHSYTKGQRSLPKQWAFEGYYLLPSVDVKSAHLLCKVSR